MRQITNSSPGFSRFPTAAILETKGPWGRGCANHPSSRVNFFVSFVNGSPSLVVKRREHFYELRYTSTFYTARGINLFHVSYAGLLKLTIVHEQKTMRMFRNRILTGAFGTFSVLSLLIEFYFFFGEPLAVGRRVRQNLWLSIRTLARYFEYIFTVGSL